MHERVSEDVFVFYGRGYDSNSYFLLGDKNILVDTGTGANFVDVAGNLNAFGFSVKDVDIVVNTHCHFDHVGGNRFFDATFYAHPLDADYIARADPQYTLSSMFGADLLPCDIKPIPEEVQGWRVIHTPGHSEGSVCLLKDKILVSGDTLFADGVGRTDLPGADQAKLENSLKLIKTLDFSILLPGHGRTLKK
ncbi:MAG: MBL fold metallo-hydrolase [Candidatus Diapherotrites archaeon]|nr:MBL fold metallo-hydrolase [Candidatus Diapherotrites archaeon]